MQGRRRAVQAGHDLGRAGGDGQKRLGDAGKIGRQRAHAHHRAAGPDGSLTAVMMRSGCILRGGLLLGVCMVVYRAAMHVSRRHLVMHRHGIRQQGFIKTRRRAAAPGKACRRREHAEQIGEGDDPPHPDPHRSCQSQQHSADKVFRAAMLHTLIAN